MANPFLLAAITRVLKYKIRCHKCRREQIASATRREKPHCKFCGAFLEAPKSGR